MITKSLKFTKQLILNVFKFVVGLVLILLQVPLFIVLVFPFIIYRRLLFHSAKYLRSDLGKMLNAQSTLYTPENVYKSPKCKLVIGIVAEGCPSLEQFRTGIKSTIDQTDLKTGDKVYPELSQKVTSWMGYLFWEPIKDFNYKDYVEYIDNTQKPLSFEQAERLCTEETSVPFAMDTALWKVQVYTNYIPHETDKFAQSGLQYSLVVFCIHHCLVDGFSFIKLINKMFNMNMNKKEVSKVKSSNMFLIKRVFKAAALCLKVPRDVGNFVLTQLFSRTIWDEKALRRYEKGIEDKETNTELKKNAFMGKCSEIISFERIKEIRNAQGVTSIAVIISAIAGSIRDNMFHNSLKIPQKIQFALPIPLPGHPDKLRNHVSGGLLDIYRTAVALGLPVGEADPLKRLRKINKTILNLKNSTFPLVTVWINKALGSFPHVIFKKLVELSSKTEFVFLSSFPGPAEEIKMYGTCTAKDYLWMCSGTSGTKVLSCVFTTFGGNGRFLVGADVSVLPTDQHATDLILGFTHQLDLMQNIASMPETV